MVYFIFCFWLLGFFLLWHIPDFRQNRNLHLPGSRISVIIPARNEGKNLARLLESITLQDSDLAEIIVVDDQSQDTTAQTAEKFGHQVISSSIPPEGWLGKPWACWQGAKAASNDILLFLDADVILEPCAFSKLLSMFLEKEGLLTVQPYHMLKKNYERLSAIFNIIVMAGVNAFTPLQSRLKPAGAFGPCMMCRQKTYFEVGGHKTVRQFILESIPMGKAFINAGHDVHCVGGKGAISFRMYPDGLRSLVEGFSKGFVTGANAISSSIMIMLVCWIFGGVSLTRHLLESLIAGDMNAMLIWLLLDFLYVAQIQWMLSRIGSFGVRTAILFQIPLLFFVLIFSLSIFKTLVMRKVSWKGRDITPP
jgi:4,4'-diaponeurosporenoate glycosyltransferase